MIEREQIGIWNADIISILSNVTCPQVLCVLLRPPAHPTKKNFIKTF
jgi:hypothetical protein